MSSSNQGNPPARPAPPTSSSSGHSELTIEGGRALSQLEQYATVGRTSSKTRSIPSITQGLAAVQLGPAIMLNPLGHHVVGHAASDSDATSVSSGKSSKLGFRKRFSALFKGHQKDKDAATHAPATPPPARSGHCIHSDGPDVKSLADDLESVISTQPVNDVSIIQVQASPVALDMLSPGIFPENVHPATFKPNLPKPHARIEETTQLVYGCQLLSMGQPYSPASDTDEVLVIPLDEIQKAWVQLIDPMEQDRLHWIIEKLVRAFDEDGLKGSAAIAEIVLVGPILDREL
ncbi:hypothetical protein BGW39_001387, partial [Mortierella sp. 14UC]